MGRGGDEQPIIRSPILSGDYNTRFKVFARRLWRINSSGGTLTSWSCRNGHNGYFWRAPTITQLAREPINIHKTHHNTYLSPLSLVLSQILTSVNRSFWILCLTPLTLKAVIYRLTFSYQVCMCTVKILLIITDFRAKIYYNFTWWRLLYGLNIYKTSAVLLGLWTEHSCWHK